MYILSDTCSVLMLIRIAPDMFVDENFNCVTTRDVWRELFRTQKFKSKYPWRVRFKSKIRPLKNSAVQTKDFFLYLQVIQKQIKNGIINSRTDLFFDLSKVDQRIVACALSNRFLLTTTDRDMIDYYLKQFSNNPAEIISPLGMINRWLETGLISWSEKNQTITEDWLKCEEPAQPKAEIRKFKKLTGFKYAGP